MTSSGYRPRRRSSSCRRPAWWAPASRSTHSDGGREQDPVPGLAGADRDPGGEVGLAGAGRSEEDDVLLGGDEVQGAQVRDEVAAQAAGVVEVELLQGLSGREPGGADPSFAAVGLAGGHLALQARGEELLVGPGLGAGAFDQPRDGLTQRRRLQRAGQERQLAAHVTPGASRTSGAARSSCVVLRVRVVITPPRCPQHRDRPDRGRP